MTFVSEPRPRAGRAEPPAAPAEAPGVQLGLGLLVCGLIMFGFFVFRFLTITSPGPGALLSAAGWAILLGVLAVGLVGLRRNGMRVTSRMIAVAVPLLTIACLLDRCGTVVAGPPYSSSSVTGAIGGVIIALAPLRPTREMLLALGGLAVLRIIPDVVLVMHAGALTPLALSSDVLIFVPATLAIALTASLRRMGGMAADRARLHGTLATRSADSGHQPWAGTRIGALDSEIEGLFGAISRGDIPLPLDAERSARAGELAAELRQLLLSGKRETWLNHAVADSSVLAGAITVTDPESIASELDSTARDALVSALWLLCSGRTRGAVAGEVSFARATVAGGSTRSELRIRLTGVRRREVESNLWELLRQIGPHSSEARDGGISLTVTIEPR
ncbi:hypothetical protein [Mycetocola reblochoni]|uniref:Uncharacterized protein n=2 Tax=Mycetocola reblochoni TaxID=331618 RepID=A0A1R4JS55_9MICO|nr:hypothetical protein [Mycetocola reblochoni]RLP70423.1 hypothetical protein D9V30_02635 [Mycetocola reblochoni]SJN35071.1 hypothetical protein FM119_09215 [Mycetocola reblochoni REB411]